jgi:Ran GTPase-activating protein (RanGAP) involved in mRNA processing and transport
MNSISINTLREVIKFTRSVTHLNISWNTIPPQSMLSILELLAKNRRLTDLNLSWNNLILPQDSIKQQEYVLKLLANLIKFNKKFQHFDLSGTGLTKFMCHALGK